MWQEFKFRRQNLLECRLWKGLLPVWRNQQCCTTHSWLYVRTVTVFVKICITVYRSLITPPCAHRHLLTLNIHQSLSFVTSTPSGFSFFSSNVTFPMSVCVYPYLALLPLITMFCGSAFHRYVCLSVCLPIWCISVFLLCCSIFISLIGLSNY